MEHGQYWPVSANILVWQLCLWILLLGPHHHHWNIPHRKIHYLAARPQEKCYRSYTVAACLCTCTSLASFGFPPLCFYHPKENIMWWWLLLLLNNLTFYWKSLPVKLRSSHNHHGNISVWDETILLWYQVRHWLALASSHHIGIESN